jgi:hypothetical protein
MLPTVMSLMPMQGNIWVMTSPLQPPTRRREICHRCQRLISTKLVPQVVPADDTVLGKGMTDMLSTSPPQDQCQKGLSSRVPDEYLSYGGCKERVAASRLELT